MFDAIIPLLDAAQIDDSSDPFTIGQRTSGERRAGDQRQSILKKPNTVHRFNEFDGATLALYFLGRSKSAELLCHPKFSWLDACTGPPTGHP
jgi:hypothetical protein